jgi:antitoxin component YwqK of YwqJK toxin-antitoxin module
MATYPMGQPCLYTLTTAVYPCGCVETKGTWWNGVLKSSIKKNKSGAVVGLCEEYTPDGAAIDVFFMKNGVIEGERRWLHENSFWRATYVNGKLNGPVEIYKQGCLNKRGTYLNGVLDGEMIEYWPDKTIPRNIDLWQDGDVIKSITFNIFGDAVAIYKKVCGVLVPCTR